MAILTPAELASIRRPYRAASLLPRRAWDMTNRQDWHVCELQQQGTKSRSWVSGRFSNQEASVHAFDLMCADHYANDGIETRRTVRERYDTLPPKTEASAAIATAAKSDVRLKARAAPKP